MSDPEMLTPEVQLTNALASLATLADAAPFAGQLPALRLAIAETQAAWEQYQAGELAPVPDALPF